MKKRIRPWIFGLLIGMLVFAGATGIGAKTNVVKLPFNDTTGNIPSFVPYYWQVQHILAQGTIFEGLFGYAPDPKGLGGVKIVPVIAESWSCSADGKTWTIKLRRDKKWSNGDPVTARDFEWANQFICGPEIPDVPIWAGHLQFVKNGWNLKGGGVSVDELGVKALDDYTIQYTLDFARYDFNCWLAVAGAMPLHRKTIEKWGVNQWWKPGNFVGNGPYIPASWTDHKEAVLIKNKNYVGTCGNVDQIILKNFAPGVSQIQAYQAGEIDLAWIYGSNGALADYKYAMSRPDLKKAYREVPADLTWSGYQVTRSFSQYLDNPKLRQAFALAIDRTTLCKTVLNGRSYPIGKYWGDNDPIGQKMKAVPFDVVKAKKLMAEAGYPGGKGLPQLTFYITGNMPEVEYIVDQWKKHLGVKVNIDNLENAVYWNQYVWSNWTPEAKPGFVRINSGMNSLASDTLDKNAGQVFWALGFPAAVRKKAYDLDQLYRGFLTKEGGVAAADWEPLFAKKAKINTDLKAIAAKEPSKIWVEDLCTRKPVFTEQFDEIYAKWKNAKTDKEKTEAWRMENRLLLSTERKVLEYNGRSEPVKAALRLLFQIRNSNFDQAVALTPQCSQLLQDQFYMVPLYMEKYQYVQRPNLTGMNIYKFSWGPTLFNLKYLNVK